MTTVFNIQRLIVFADTLTNIQANIASLGELALGRDTATGLLYYSPDDGATWMLVSGTNVDEKTKVSSNDTTAGYLNGKLVAGPGVELTENNDGSNETLTIAAPTVISSTSTIATGDTAYLIGPIRIDGSLTINGSMNLL